ncbi:hypothetical protein EJ03DRAFT_342398 [Teratosphaeria nubilosa]|uniref:Mid2 domain-containing protein n=1 Tax=Teratosphaeria nubilosa TaxID=161662 RepID=A0A6G1LG23_9PEZI|nr:hypothetical protein EJ03DRAFT_342398 [Teratosphaeria nubilosa]
MLLLSAFGFAQINAEELHLGILPKRQATSASETTASAQSSSAENTSAASSAASSAQSSAAESSSVASSAESSAAHTTSSTELPTDIAVTTTNSDGSTVTSSISTSTLAPATTSSAAVRTETGKSSNIVVIGSSTINRSTLSSATTITSALIAEATIPSTYTSYWTTDGHVQSSVVKTSRVVSSTTGYATATLTPSLANGGGSGDNLSTSSKKIIGGVIGGIGGAVLIGGLAVVAWRLWGKKKDREALPQDDFLDSQNDSIRREKRGSGQPLSGSYQNPNGPVNTASNF